VKPARWYWSHDIGPDQFTGTLAIPGTRLVRLSSYGTRDRPRFAALIYEEPGPLRRPLLDLGPEALDGVRAVSVTADPGQPPRFSLLTEPGPVDSTVVRAGLDEDGLRAVLGEGWGIVDLAVYASGGGRRYAAVLERRAEPSWLVTGTELGAVKRELRRLGAAPTRLRTDGTGHLTAVADRSFRGRWRWYADLDADGVAGRLEAHRAYPVDLDARRDERGVRYSVVMRR
jgi:hypothetical protein